MIRFHVSIPKGAQSRLLPLLLAALIGALAFLTLYGTVPLDVTNDAWLLNGYDEPDIMQHYAGWLGYRLSPWRFPLGFTEKIAIGTGTIISYTDSIPWVAVFFRALRRFLPTTFQYFGLYGLLCFVLQGVSSYLLLEYFTKNRPYSLIGSILFCFSPIMIERMFRHTALASHWLILFSLLVYFRYRAQKQRYTWAFFLLLESLAIGIHPYFLPLVASCSLLCVIEDLRHRRWLSIPAFLGQQAFVLLVGYILGAVGSGVKASRDGFGYWCMNLNALVNPRSCGGYTWSRFLPVQEQTLGNYDGFNYLGLGVLAALAVLAVLAAAWLLAGGWRKRGAWGLWLKRNLWLLLVAFGLSAFAVSNVVTLNGEVLFEYPLPEPILYLCGIFRASSRMFYLVYYLVFLSVLVLIWRNRSRVLKIGGRGTLMACAACVLLCTVQLWDLSGMILEKHEKMAGATQIGLSGELYTAPEMLEAAQNSERLISVEGDWSRPLAVWALKNGMDVHYPLAVSNLDLTAWKLRTDEILQSICGSKDLQHTVLIMFAENNYQTYMTCDDAKSYQLEGGTYIVYQGDE